MNNKRPKIDPKPNFIAKRFQFHRRNKKKSGEIKAIQYRARPKQSCAAIVWLSTVSLWTEEQEHLNS